MPFTSKEGLGEGPGPIHTDMQFGGGVYKGNICIHIAVPHIYIQSELGINPLDATKVNLSEKASV